MTLKTQTRTATFERAAANPNARIYPVVISTETPVTRDGYIEVLSHDASAINLARAPLPVIESHDRSRVNVGKVDNLRIEARKLRGDLILGSSARASELAADIDADIVTGISIGYSIEAEDQEGATITATRWMPFEVSIVAVPADIAAGINRELPNMTNTEPYAAVIAERSRVIQIQQLAAQHTLGDEFARSLIENGADLETVRSRALTVLADRSPAVLPPLRDSRSTSGDDFRDAAVDALLVRAGITVASPHAAARDLHSTSLTEIARTCLSRTSVRHGGLSGPDVLQRAMSSSDFPLILENVAAKALRQGYIEETGTHARWTKRTTANDFKPLSRVILGTAPDVELVAESGTYTHGSFDEDKESFSIAKYGRLIRITWEAMVNDNLSAFTSIPNAMGQAARRNEADLVYQVILSNSLAGQTMRDNVALFHSTHANIATGAGLWDALNDGRLKMRRQTGLGGATLNLAPRFLIVPPELESEAERLLANTTRITVTGIETVQGWTSNLELIVESRLTSDSKVYLSASPTVIDTVEVANLAGGETPQIFQEDSFDTDAKTYKVRHTVGTRAIDHRGLVRVDIT